MSSTTPTPTSASPLSPPTRPGAVRQHSRSDSENTAYSVDFDALLGGDKDEDDFDLNAEPPVDVVRSEDVDGPSDFTQNMEFWMRAQLSGRKEDRRQDAPKPHERQNATPTPPPPPVHTVPIHSEPEAPYNGRRTMSPEQLQEKDEPAYESDVDENGAQAAMDDLEGYVISDEQDEETMMPPSGEGSIDEQIEILSSMDDVNDNKHDSDNDNNNNNNHKPAPPSPSRQTYGDLKPATPAKIPWLQAAIEEHLGTPPSARPSLASARTLSADTPELRIDNRDLFRRAHPNIRPTFSRTNSAISRPSVSRENSASSRPTLSRYNSWAPTGMYSAPPSGLNSRANSGQHSQDLLSQISKLTSELEHQKIGNSSKIISLESNLERTKSELVGARENVQKRVREVTAQHNERVRELEAHWQQRLASAQEQYQRDLQEQKAAFALVQTSLQSRLSGTESGLHALLSQKDAEIDAAKSVHKQELEQQRVGYKAKVSALEERLHALQTQVTEQAKEQDREKDNDYFQNGVPKEKLEEELAAQKARVAELEATLATTKAQLASTRAQSLSKGKLNASVIEGHRQADELLTRSKEQVSELESSLAILRNQLSQARHEINDARRDADNARDSAQLLREELTESQNLVAEKTRRIDELRDQLEEERTKSTAGRDTARMLENARNDLEEERASSTKRIRELETQLEEQQHEQKNKIDGMRNRAEDAVRKAGTLLNGERIEKASLKTALKAVKSEVDGLKQQMQHLQNQKRQDGLSKADAKEKEEEMERLRATLREQAIAAKVARAETDAAKKEMQVMKEDHESVNRAMDERIVLLVQKREREWQARFEKLQQEKKALGRALMREWGKEECGVTDPQEYKYRFLDLRK